MSNPAYLVHTGNGRVFPFSDVMLKRPDMQPAVDLEDAHTKARRFGGQPAEPIARSLPNKPENVPAPDASEASAIAERFAALEDRIAALEQGQPSGDEQTNETDDTFVISKANKDELEAFAKAHYSVDLDKRKKVDDLRAEVMALAESSGESE